MSCIVNFPRHCFNYFSRSSAAPEMSSVQRAQQKINRVAETVEKGFNLCGNTPIVGCFSGSARVTVGSVQNSIGSLVVTGAAIARLFSSNPRIMEAARLGFQHKMHGNFNTLRGALELAAGITGIGTISLNLYNFHSDHLTKPYVAYDQTFSTKGASAFAQDYATIDALFNKVACIPVLGGISSLVQVFSGLGNLIEATLHLVLYFLASLIRDGEDVQGMIKELLVQLKFGCVNLIRGLFNTLMAASIIGSILMLGIQELRNQFANPVTY